MENHKLDLAKIEYAVERLEKNLPIRSRQTQLSPELRRLHQSILRFYLENGRAPDSKTLEFWKAKPSDIKQLGAEHIIVPNAQGEITSAYPFVNKARSFTVITEYGPAHAMCAFDALAISSMFNLPTRIESHCRLTETPVVVEQNDDDIRVLEPQGSVYAAIDWGAAAGASSCSTTLCCEMIFIAGEDNAGHWQREAANSRELFGLREAHAFISTVFVPLMK